MIDSSTKNPYNLSEYKTSKLKIFNSKKDQKTRNDLVDYLFKFQITGTNDNNLLLLSTGYISNNKDNDNYFILDENDIDNLISELEEVKEKIAISRLVADRIVDLHAQLNEYMKAGYVDYIELELKKDYLPPYFQKELYKTFIIRPIFKKDIDIPPEVNTAFNFIEVLHLDINEGKFDETMNYIRDYNDIHIHFIGYDHADEIKKRQKEALKDLDDATKNGHRYKRSPEDIAKYQKMMKELNIPFNLATNNIKK